MDFTEVPPKRRKIASGVGQTSSSTPSISKNDYEVFLSFRGSDTRQGFTNCLYHALIDAGIVVFKDDNELQPGSKIEDILNGLDNSEICIVVLSSNFATSTWCLREVERMVSMKKDMVPIFYDVTPDDVKLETDLYANALNKHEAKYGKEKVQLWRDALKQIPPIKGRELKNTGYTEFCKQTAKEILTKLKVKFKYEIKHLVEVPDELEAALKLLAIGSDDGRRSVGIHGMGGIGKTTLAKIIFDQISDKFDCSCFLEDIRECLSQGTHGLHMLQVRLLKSLDPSVQDSIVDPMNEIQKKFQRKNVIIVLDDVDQVSHLDSLVGDSSWFGKGSRIIFTTRNAELHEKWTLSDAHFYGLEKKEMNSKQALTLFSKHAFGKDSPPEDFKDLSDEAVSTTGRLPLALEVVGSLLHRRKAKIWREKIKTLKEAPHLNVQLKLKISYDALDVKQQEIFLDIACFFIGEDKKKAVYMWEACEFDPNYGIEVLISMSLIKLDGKKCFLMHDQLRDLGRAIAAGSRFWKHEDAAELLNRNVGKGKVVALNLTKPSGYLNREIFVGLEKLRFLQLTECGDFRGDFGSLIPTLRWLSLRFVSSFNTSNLYLRELVVLELFRFKFDQNWPGWGQILISKKLKVLTLLECYELITLPDLSEVVNLERLVIEKCSKLTFVCSSIGRLHRLRRLSIKRCHSLRELPESIGCLVSLTRLEVDGINNLPNSIGELAELKHLSLTYSEKLRVLPDSIGDLRSLISLDLERSGITELPTTIGRLAKLQSLCLCNCRELQRLPDRVGNLHSLMDLDISGKNSIAELPRSFVNLTSLQKLNMGGKKNPSVYSRLSQEVFTALYSWNLDFYDYREVDALPGGLTWLRVSRVERMKNLSNLINLSYLEIVNDNGYIEEGSKGTVVLEGIEKLIKLNELVIRCCSVKSLSTDQWGALQQLKTLRLECPSLEFGECQFPSNLESLYLYVKEWGKMPSSLSSMKNLRKLNLINFVIEESDWPVQGLECLEVLELWSCSFSTTLICFDTSQLNHLVHLKIFGCKNLVDLQGIGKLKSLTKLDMSNCDSLRRIEDLSELNRLASIHISDCNNLVDIQGIGKLKSLTTLGIEYCNSLQRIADLSELSRLATIDIVNCNNLVNIQGIGKLKSLTKLWISHCASLRRIEDLSECNRLESIYIFLCDKFEGIEGGVDKLLSACTSLSAIDIKRCKCEDVEYPLPNVFEPIPPRPRSVYVNLCDPGFDIPEPSFIPTALGDYSGLGKLDDIIGGPRETDTNMVESNVFTRRPGKEAMESDDIVQGIIGLSETDTTSMVESNGDEVFIRNEPMMDLTLTL